jgi:hypothetical protein
MQMPVKRLASQRHTTPSDNSSSEGQDQFVISPCPRRATQKASRRGEGSSSQEDEEAAKVAEGRVMATAREARESDVM